MSGENCEFPYCRSAKIKHTRWHASTFIAVTVFLLCIYRPSPLTLPYLESCNIGASCNLRRVLTRWKSELKVNKRTFPHQRRGKAGANLLDRQQRNIIIRIPCLTNLKIYLVMRSTPPGVFYFSSKRTFVFLITIFQMIKRRESFYVTLKVYLFQYRIQIFFDYKTEY